MRYSSTSGGAGTIAENVVAGSVPMATATSMRLPRMRVTVCWLIGVVETAAVVPPEVAAIRSTAAAWSLVVARIRSRSCSAAFFWRCQCMPVERLS